MSDFDFNGAEPQRGSFDLIPDGEIVLVVAHLRPGQEGPGGYLKANKDRNALMADFEFTIDGGQYDRRKIWSNWITEGQTDGQQKAANITRSRLRAALESAYGVDPKDDSAAAIAKRQVAGWGAFDGLKFCARVGIEKSKDPQYADKNTLTPVTPDDDDYISPGAQVTAQTSAAVASAAQAKAGNGAVKPAWAS